MSVPLIVVMPPWRRLPPIEEVATI
jgi:hypothetical protein